MFDINIKCIYDETIRFKWDESKRIANIRERRLDFADAKLMFHGRMVVRLDKRLDYGEIRYLAYGLVKNRLMAVVYTQREQNIIRIISFRKANKREQAFYEKKIKN